MVEVQNQPTQNLESLDWLLQMQLPHSADACRRKEAMLQPLGLQV
jgi:hypothetical protein